MICDYRVDAVRIDMPDSAVLDGTAPAKMAHEIELKLREWAVKGYEFVKSDVVTQEVKGSCLFGLMASCDNDVHMTSVILYFRRNVP